MPGSLRDRVIVLVAVNRVVVARVEMMCPDISMIDLM